MRWIFLLLAPLAAARAQDAGPREPVLTAVYTLADHHTSRWTSERDPLVKIAGVCQVIPGGAIYTLSCSAPPVAEPRSGRRQFYSVVLFRDLNENLYLAACSATARESTCSLLKAGETFSAEVDDRTIRVVIRDEQLPLRILERRPKPVEIDSPTPGAPSNVRPSAGAPSAVPWSRASESRGAPSDVRTSEVSASAGAPSAVTPSEVSTAVASPTSARLYVYCNTSAAQVYIDDQLLGHPPLEAPVVPGRHTVRVQAPGRADWVRRLDVPAGKVTKITADLR